MKYPYLLGGSASWVINTRSSDSLDQISSTTLRFWRLMINGIQLLFLWWQKNVAEWTPQHLGTSLDQISSTTWWICLLSDKCNAALVPLAAKECCRKDTSTLEAQLLRHQVNPLLLLESNQERIILIGSETKCHAGFDVHWNLVEKFFDNLLT